MIVVITVGCSQCHLSFTGGFLNREPVLCLNCGRVLHEWQQPNTAWSATSLAHLLAKIRAVVAARLNHVS